VLLVFAELAAVLIGGRRYRILPRSSIRRVAECGATAIGLRRSLGDAGVVNAIRPEVCVCTRGLRLLDGKARLWSTMRTIGVDMTYRFHAGQSVHLKRSLSNRSAALGAYKIVRLLPDTGGELQYRIKSLREPHERVVNESELESV
jgi:hypothetical protein